MEALLEATLVLLDIWPPLADGLRETPPPLVDPRLEAAPPPLADCRREACIAQLLLYSYVRQL